MKKIYFLLAGLVVLGGLTWAGIAWLGPKSVVRALSTVAPDKAKAASSAPPVAPLLAHNEWHQYHNDREAVLKASPALASEYQGILQEMTDHQAKLEAAMIKADPDAAPVIKKLAGLRQKNGGPGVAGAPTAELTADDMQELRTARFKAQAADPSLSADTKKIADQLHVFQGKLDATMVKSDPSISPVIAKFEGGRPPTAVTNSSSAK